MLKRKQGRRPRFNTRMSAIRNAAARMIAAPLYRLPPVARFLSGLLALAVLTTLLLAWTHTQSPVDLYEKGDVVRVDVISPADVTAENEEETARRRADAMEATLPIWSYYPTRAEDATQKFRSSWESLRTRSERRRAIESNSNILNPSRFDIPWEGPGNRLAAGRAIIAHRFDEATLERLIDMIADAYRDRTGEVYVYDDEEAERVRREIRLVNTSTGVETTVSQNNLIPLSRARGAVRERISLLSGWTNEEREALFSVISPLIEPSVRFDRTATEAARLAAADAVPPAVVSLKRNQIVAREHDTVTPQMLSQFKAIQNYSRSTRRPHHFIGIFLLSLALYAAAWRFVEYRSETTTLPISKGKAFTLVGLSLIVMLVLMRIGFLLAQGISSQSVAPPLNDPVVWGFAVPFAAGALLVAMLVDTQLALITGVLTAIFAGLLAPNGILMASYAMISASAAIYGIRRYRERQSVTVAGLVVGGVNALMALAVLLSAQRPFTLTSALLALGCGLVGGILTTIFTAGGLPVNESLFGVLTDVKLLELSNADLPVLGQLALRAPGTNQHSHAVGQLAEEACRAIDANPLLARIGALYHDIGKLAAPDHFIENQTGDNPHDRLKPQQSARIITSHVTYGLKLAKEIGLPKQIADFIPQHHGTRTLHFFLRKAQATAPEGEKMDEAEFRYPGPKPQFKEAAVMMLADSCEAAARSLSRPDPQNIRSIVTKIFDAIISDGQLDECDLTLREVTTIRESIITALTAIYHARIDYPGFNPPAPDASTHAPLPSPDLDSEERGIGYRKPSEVPISKGGEVEDEALTGNKRD